MTNIEIILTWKHRLTNGLSLKLINRATYRLVGKSSDSHTIGPRFETPSGMWLFILILYFLQWKWHKNILLKTFALPHGFANTADRCDIPERWQITNVNLFITIFIVLKAAITTAISCFYDLISTIFMQHKL